MQPFEYQNWVGVFNGEIYNSEQLIDKYDLHTNSGSDTEIILPLFAKIGSSIIDELDGFYAGLIYDKQKELYFFIRDYIGKKPLFFGRTSEYSFVTSELKAIDVVDKFIAIPKGFSELVNGEIHLLKSHVISYASEEPIFDLVHKATLKRIPRKQEKFGVLLSGGLDSSIIAYIVAAHNKNVTYYSLANPDSLDYNYVVELVQNLGIDQQTKFVSLPNANEMRSLVEKIVYSTESYNPSIISNGLATYILSQKAHQDGIKVVLSGEGADELFCGYPISKDINFCFSKRAELIENMEFTELRRLDLSSMANTIEVRCPFIDRSIFNFSNSLLLPDLFELKQGRYYGKKPLRNAFENYLPPSIISREKTSFDVGSGIRKLVIEYLKQFGLSERDSLKRILSQVYEAEFIEHPYFHSYPTFDPLIENRGALHK
jgi:asparagine synthase (glutamine-hydrolysing)